MPKVTLTTPQLTVLYQHLNERRATDDQVVIIYDVQVKLISILESCTPTRESVCPTCGVKFEGGRDLPLTKIRALPEEVRLRTDEHEIELSQAELNMINEFYRDKETSVPTSHEFLNIFVPMRKALKQA